MLFPTLTFALFFLALFALAWIVRTPSEWGKIILLVASWIFYGAWDWRFVGLLVASGLLNWFTARQIDAVRNPSRRRALMVGGVVANLAILGVFKYCGFFLDQVSEGLRLLGWARDLPVIQVILPVGVSFFTFQGMSYLIDVARGHLKPASLLNVALLQSFFAHLIAGPIVRGSDLIPQFERGPRLSRDTAALGVLMIVWGLFKKTVIASELATGLVDPVFFDPGAHSPIDLVAATYGYAVQIYADFSAYSDMAIGLAALLGFSFPRNFDQPYRAIGLRDFWRRWHITLSSWLRDYLYIPLGGSRRGLAATCRNLMVTTILGGLWHGAAWKFAAWGALHGTGLSIEHVWARFRPAPLPAAAKAVGVLVTFHVVCLAWIFFRADSFATAIAFIRGLARWNDAPLALTPMALGLIAFGLLLNASPPRLIEAVARRVGRLPAPAFGLAAGVMFLCIDALKPAGVQAFIYYQF